jgi:hypothetical protein
MYRQKVMYMDRQLDEQMYGYVDKQKDGEKDVKTDRLKQEDIYDANVKLQLLSTKSFKALFNRPQWPTVNDKKIGSAEIAQHFCLIVDKGLSLHLLLLLLLSA